ncbi:MAG TPA: asparagine synthase (glutamine-hydrolyzing) [Candidatus Bathyarchaeia archaeon]|nr:asparagine synthase (glutamine-hydrolyzing) [Candidatus Bathyarchaeia archaeon]
MCGICGICYSDRSKRPDLHALARMNNAMAHRGPDDAGLWDGGHVALAMRRLSILDLPGGHQPMANEDESIRLVFNGEIYNFQELRAGLEKTGHVFRTNSDTEVIVHAYEQYGDDCLSRLNGMFVFALYDARRDRLLIARDRLGIKPLFYTVNGGALVFASELGALVQSGRVEKKVNPAALDAYFTFLYIPAPDTIYENVRKLRPAHKLVFERGAVSTSQYWRLRFEPDDSWTLDSAAERYLELARDAVRLQRISDVPLGALLSGGIDSSSVVALLSECTDRPVKTFSIGFDDAHANELEWARIAAQRFNTDHTEEILAPDIAGFARKIAPHFGEPFADSSAVPTWLVSSVARRHVTVALSGDGGDECFAGYEWTKMNRHVAAVRNIPAPLRNIAAAALAALPSDPRLQKVIRVLYDARLIPRDAFRRRLTCFPPSLKTRLYQPDFATSLRKPFIDRFNEHADAGPTDPDNWMLYQDTVMYLPDDILTKVDRTSMANSIEARVPLLDHRIVEFAATLPFSLKLDRGVSKRVVKHALQNILPPELLVQRKRGFAVPIHRWFRGGLRAPFEQAVLAPGSRCTQFIEPAVARMLLDQHLAGRENYGHHLWALLMLEYWMESANV